MSNANLNLLMKALGYQFQDESLLTQALTHRSYASAHNERLEFLGDAVLGFIIAQLLYARFSRADEGQLTRLRSNLVKGATLAELARELNLGQYLLLGPGEAKSGGAHRKSTLEDTVEAIIGALYLDAGLERCREIVSQWFLPRVDAISLQANPRDAKTTLQEYLQSEGIKLPTYQLLRTEGQEHDQTFYVLCEVSEKGWKTEGSGKTRKAAEQMAAQTLLDQVYASQSS